MVMVSEEFLVRLRYWLVSGGMIMCMVCGSIICFMVRCGFRFSAVVVSFWLRLIDWMLLCTILAMKVVV